MVRKMLNIIWKSVLEFNFAGLDSQFLKKGQMQCTALDNPLRKNVIKEEILLISMLMDQSGSGSNILSESGSGFYDQKWKKI
jgi:hypothetical protein